MLSGIIETITKKVGFSARSARVYLPLPYLRDLGVDEKNPNVKLYKEGNKIVIEKAN